MTFKIKTGRILSNVGTNGTGHNKRPIVKEVQFLSLINGKRKVNHE